MEQLEREQHRKTSIAAYHKILECGLLTEARLEVYRIIFDSRHYPTTSAEIGLRLDRRLQHTRLTELRDMKVIEEGPERECTVTGHKVLTWVVTGRLPEALKSKPKRVKQPSREVLERVIATLRADRSWSRLCGVERDEDGAIEWLEYRRDMSK